MKFTIKKQCLVEALNKMAAVSTNAVKSDYDQAFRVTINAEAKQAIFLASNGHLSARYELTKEKDPQYACEEEGVATVDVLAVLKIAQALGGETTDNIFLVSTDTGSSPALAIKDTSSRVKKMVKLQLLSENHKFALAKPKKGFAYTFKCDDFIRSINRVAKYVTKHVYKVRYLMICMHFLKDEIRFVAGDGGRFAVYGYKAPTNASDEETKFLLPADQAKILCSLLANTNEVEFVFEDDTFYIKPQSELTMVLKGIPKEKYISYEKHAFRSDEAKAILDIQTKDLVEVCALLNAARDKELEQQTFPSVWVESDSAKHLATFQQLEGRYLTDYECPVEHYPLTGFPTYRSHYALEYLTDCCHAWNSDLVRYYLIDEAKTIIVRPINIDEANKSDKGVPSIKGDDGSYLTFFFSAVSDDKEQG